MTSKIIIFDANYVCHVARHSMGELTYDNVRVGILFGFFRQILSLSKRFETDQFVFVWDSTSSLRKEIYPEYKNNRAKNYTEEEKKENLLIYSQFNLLKNELIHKLGFTNNYECKGYEGDDLIASILNTNFFKENIIVSSDNDLFQLLESGSRTVKLYSITKKEVYSYEDFTKEWGCYPSTWIEVKATAGCKSDNILGVPGVGEKTALKYIKGLMRVGSKKVDEIKRNEPLIERNRKLVSLPYEGTPTIKLKPFDNLYISDFLDVFDMYGFDSLITKESLEQWKKHLSLE